MVDYGKWDNLQLSDDSDIEVHPNVDKRSFIRAKQSQIHAERQQRKIEIQALKYERTINDTLSDRLSALIADLKAQTDVDASSAPTLVFQAVMKTAPTDADDDKPPARPEGVFADDQPPTPTYSRMLCSLFDQVNKKLDADGIQPSERYSAIIEELETHAHKIQELQKELGTKLNGLETEDTAKITSDTYHIGFDSSHVNKSKASAEKSTSNVELLNPGVITETLVGDDRSSKPVEAQYDGDDSIQASATAKTFAAIPMADYRASWAFISKHPEILRESETDGLLAESLREAYENMSDSNVRQLVHQALTLQYCRLLGRNGVDAFFKSVVDPTHRASELFYNDAAQQVERIREFASKRIEERERGVEQIQIQTVEPGTSIQVRIPDAIIDDDESRRARSIFDDFAPEMKTALESGSLDNVNEVLAKMDVKEAESLVGLLGEAGCLDINGDVIDTTTEEGRRRVSEIEQGDLD